MYSVHRLLPSGGGGGWCFEFDLPLPLVYSCCCTSSVSLQLHLDRKSNQIDKSTEGEYAYGEV